MKVNRNQTIKELIKKLGYKEYLNEDVLAELKNEGEKNVDVEFFKLGKYISPSDLLKEYETRKLIPDVGAVVTYLIENPNVLDEKEWIGVQLADNAFAAFDRWGGGRKVYVYRDDRDWNDYWWFSGAKKQSFNTPQSIEVLETEKETVAERILSNIENWKDCWNWKGTVSKDYAVMKLHSRQVRVHRLIYELLVAPIPKGYVVDHVCKNKKCINPNHLQPVTSKENTLRGTSIPAINSKKTHCKRGHSLEGGNLLKGQGNHRRCKLCKRENKK